MLDSLHDHALPESPKGEARTSVFDLDWQRAALETPAFVYSEAAIRRRLRDLGVLCSLSGCRALYAVKALTWHDVLELAAPAVDGFAVSSVFEARLAGEAGVAPDRVHFSAPVIAGDELGDLLSYCSTIVFNSFTQWTRYRGTTTPAVRCGLRVNPGLSLVADARHDPCRPHSKLGVPLETLADLHQAMPQSLQGLSGLHLHNNHNASAFDGLLRTVEAVEGRLASLLEQLDWINIGGGYRFDSDTDPGPLCEAVRRLREGHGLEVFFEPGAGVVQDACALVASVLDVFDSGGRQVAVLDTSVNHLPRVFEYQTPPAVRGDSPGAPYAYLLAGRSCLAGDLFGEYTFDAPLQPGSRIVIVDAGAYSLVKASWFNGLRLPSIYALRADGGLRLRRYFGYEDYRRLQRAVRDETSPPHDD